MIESSTASDAPEPASKGCIKHVCKKAVAHFVIEALAISPLCSAPTSDSVGGIDFVTGNGRAKGIHRSISFFSLVELSGGKKVIGLRQPSRGGDKVSLVMASMVAMAGPRYSRDGAQPIQAYPILCWVRRGLLLGWAAEQTLVICSLHGLFLGKMKHRIAFVPTQ